MQWERGLPVRQTQLLEEIGGQDARAPAKNDPLPAFFNSFGPRHNLIMRYSLIILDHVKNPRNVGELAGANACARVRSAEDGDMLQLHLRIEDNVVREARFKVYGCGAAIATGSMLTEMIIGKTTAELKSITNQQVSDSMGGLPPEKIHCSVLAEQAIQTALEDWNSRR